MSTELVPTGIVTRCCQHHQTSVSEGPLPSCCDQEDCGPCCPDCPTCPTLYASRKGLATEVQLAHDRTRRESSTGPVVLDMVVRGPSGLIVFTVHAGWTLAPFPTGARLLTASSGGPLARSITVHREIEAGMGHTEMMLCDRCEYLDGRPCYYDAGYVASEQAAQLLIEHGPTPMWGYLYDWYREHLGDEPGRSVSLHSRWRRHGARLDLGGVA